MKFLLSDERPGAHGERRRAGAVARKFARQCHAPESRALRGFRGLRADGAATSFVLFLSGDEGWNAAAQAMALALVQQGAMVAGIDLPKFKAMLEADGADCVFPDGDLENLSHFVQAYFHNPSYLAPLLAGISIRRHLGVRSAGAGAEGHFCRPL